MGRCSNKKCTNQKKKVLICASVLLHIFSYAYNAKNRLPIESNIQKMGDSLLIYSAPANAQLAERCFNDSQNKLAVWSLVFPVGEVIKRME
jgi:hypothetical protein